MGEKYNVELYDYNLEVLEDGLALIDKKVEDFTKEEISHMLAFAIGYCDFNNKTVIKEVLEDLEHSREINRRFDDGTDS